MKIIKERIIIEVGDIQIDEDDSEWVVVSISMLNGQQRASRVRRGSLAHHIHAELSLVIAESLDKEEDGTETASTGRSYTA